MGTVQTTVGGGGYQNCGARAPLGVGHNWLLVSGGDIAGVHATVDGITWRSASKGLAFGTHRLGGLIGSATVADRLWAMAARTNDGTGGSSGQLLRGAYNPATQVITWTAKGAVDPGAEAGGAPRPRHAGRLLALDEANDAVYMATIDGIWKFSNLAGTTTQTQRALPGALVTGIVLDPDDPTIMYATVRSGPSGAGVYRLTNIRSGTVGVSRKAFTVCEDLVTLIVGSARYLYVAAMTQGPQRWLISSDISTGWTSLDVGYDLGSNGCAKIDAHLTGSSAAGVKLLCGNAGDNNSSSGGSYSNDGGGTWRNEAANWNSSSIPWGETQTWWLAAFTTRSQLYDNTWDANTALIDHANPDQLFLIGRAGVWRSVDGGLSWRPAVRGMAAPVGHRVAALLGGGSKAATADTDWTCIISASTGFEIGQPPPNVEQPVAGAGRGVMFHRNGTLAYCNENGEVLTSTNPFVATPTWTNNGFGALAGGAGAGVAIGQNASGTQVLLVMREGQGIQRKLGTGTPTTVSTLDTGGGSGRVDFCWPSPGGTYGAAVYCSTGSGLLRSLDYGATWTRPLSWTSTASETVGAIDCDPTNPDLLYVTLYGAETGLYKISTASGAATKIRVGPTMTEPGPCAVNPNTGVVYVASSGLDSAGTKLYGSPASNPGGATVFDDLTDEGWAGGPFHPYDMAVTQNNEILAANNQGGYFMYRPGTVTPPDPPPAVVSPAGTYSQWGIAGDWRRLEWKLRIDDGEPGEGHFWAVDAAFAGSPTSWYVGLQEGSDLVTNPPGKLALFSVWSAIGAVAGTATGATAGAFTESGGGYRVYAPYSWILGQTYTIRVQADTARGSDWWRFDVVDDATTIRSWIGSIQVPAAWGDISGGYATAFTEWFTNEGGLTSCTLVPRVTAFFGTPGYSNTLGDTTTGGGGGGGAGTTPTERALAAATATSTGATSVSVSPTGMAAGDTMIAEFGTVGTGAGTAATAHRSSGQSPAASAQTTSISVTLSGHVAGDVAYLTVWSNSTTATSALTGPAGWTPVVGQFDNAGAGGSMACWRKVLAGTETTVTVTAAVATRMVAAWEAISGADQTTPENAVQTDPNTTGVATTVTAASVSGIANGTLVTFHGGQIDLAGTQVTWTPPTGMTERADVATTSATARNATLEAATLPITVSGTTGTKTATASAGLNQRAGITIAVQPATAAGVVHTVAGWTQVGAQQGGTSGTQFSVWRKQAAAGEAGPYVFDTQQAELVRVAVAVRAWSGTNPSAPLDGTPTVDFQTAAATITHGPATATDNNRVWLLCTAKRTAAGVTSTFTPPAGFTETVDVESVSGSQNNVAVGMHYKTVPVGSTGTAQVTSSDVATQNWAGIALLLQPPATPTTGTAVAQPLLLGLHRPTG